jgi:hypothetical protein
VYIYIYIYIYIHTHTHTQTYTYPYTHYLNCYSQGIRIDATGGKKRRVVEDEAHEFSGDDIGSLEDDQTLEDKVNLLSCIYIRTHTRAFSLEDDQTLEDKVNLLSVVYIRTHTRAFSLEVIRHPL